jgi:hypothetical protein
MFVYQRLSTSALAVPASEWLAASQVSGSPNILGAVGWLMLGGHWGARQDAKVQCYPLVVCYSLVLKMAHSQLIYLFQTVIFQFAKC